MSIQSPHPLPPDPLSSGWPSGLVDDLHVADPEQGTREFACLACVTHLRPGDARQLRRMTGVTGVIDDDRSADVHLIVAAASRRAAKRETVARVARAVPHAVVTVPDVVDYDTALLSYLDRCGDDLVEPWACFDDCAAVTGALDRW